MNTQFEIGKTYQTLGGKTVLITDFKEGESYPLLGRYEPSGIGSTWRADGSYYSPRTKSIYDLLLLEPEPIKPQVDGQDVTNKYD